MRTIQNATGGMDCLRILSKECRVDVEVGQRAWCFGRITRRNGWCLARERLDRIVGTEVDEVGEWDASQGGCGRSRRRRTHTCCSAGLLALPFPRLRLRLRLHSRNVLSAHRTPRTRRHVLCQVFTRTDVWIWDTMVGRGGDGTGEAVRNLVRNLLLSLFVPLLRYHTDVELR